MIDLDEALLDEIYAAGSDAARWLTVLAALSRLCDAAAGGIYAPKLPGGPSRGLGGYVGYNIDFEYYAAHGASRVLEDPFSAPMWEAVGGNWRRVAGALASKPGDAALQSDYYQVYQRGMDVGDILAVMLRPPAPAEPTPVLALFRPWNGRAFDTEDIARLQAYAPHLQRAAWIELDVRPDRAPQRSATLVVDQFSAPVLLLGADRRVAHSNPAARRMLANSKRALCMVDNRLKALDPDIQARLDKALELAFGSTHQAGSTTEVLMSKAESAPLLARVVPFPRREPFVHESGPLRAAVLLISRRQPLPGLPRFKRLFGLSASEAEVAAALLDGESPERIAKDRGRSLATIRAQVRGVITKTGVARAAEIPTLRPFGEFEVEG